MKKIHHLFGFLIVSSFFLTACGGSEEAPQQSNEDTLATMVAATVQAAGVEMATLEAPAESGVLLPQGNMQPLAAADCDALANAMGSTLALMVSSEAVPVTMSWTAETGSACQMVSLGNGNDFGTLFEASDALKNMLLSQGWQENLTMPCLGHGGAGAAADQSCFLRGKQACEVMVTVEPSDMALCEGIEGPIGACLEAIKSEERIFKMVLTCAEGKSSESAGYIMGEAQMLDPHTPAMTLYAVNIETGEWFSYDLPENPNGPSSFSMQVSPGAYQIFSSLGTGYATADGWSLETFVVSSGGAMTDVLLMPPGQSECGQMFGVPASPDGQHPATQGASAECITSLMAPPKTEPARIQFAAGAFSTGITKTIHPNEIHPYVLGAMQGQTMTVTLHKNPDVDGLLTIWGADGTVLISDHADAVSWEGTLPATQDYYIDVLSHDSGIFDYMLEVIIPPIGGVNGRVHPSVEPFGGGYMQGLMAHAVPLILPPSFPLADGTPAEVVPYLYKGVNGVYEASLDYGADCQGSGACLYGSMMGSLVNGSLPVGTDYFPLDLAQAKIVTLEKGISGYFVESFCGANCSDARVFWVYDGYQYMLGIKGAPEANVLALVNAAILNSIP